MKKCIQITPNESLITLSANVVYRQVPDWYGFGSRQLCLDLIRPSGGAPKPVVVWIGGGAWQEMNRHIYIPELVFLAENGYAVASVDYRISANAKFPAQIEDIKAAIRYLRTHAAELNIDPGRIAVMGESAGGYLAALAGATGATRQFDTGDCPEQSSAVQCVVDWYGPVDLSSLPYAEHPATPQALLLGATPAADPERARLASPITYVSPQTPPTLILHGNSDRLVPIAQSRAYYDKLVENGVDADLYELDGVDHGGPAFTAPEIKRIILDFLNYHLQ